MRPKRGSEKCFGKCFCSASPQTPSVAADTSKSVDQRLHENSEVRTPDELPQPAFPSDDILHQGLQSASRDAVAEAAESVRSTAVAGVDKVSETLFGKTADVKREE